MSPVYNLLDEPWLPVRYLDGSTRDVGLLQVFTDARRIATLAETSPPGLIAQYRLLLAILHRAMIGHMGDWKDRDRHRWYEEGLPDAAVAEYLSRWREKFWVFHPEQPFMQAALLGDLPETRDKQKPWTQISLASASGNIPTVFDHACDTSPSSITPAAAMRSLLAFLQFTPGGLVKTIRSADKAGPLANTAAVFPLGETLEQTLCLALHPARPDQEDLPVWEKAVPTSQALESDALPAAGPNDRYTRLSRAVLLLPEQDGNVRWLKFAAGVALLESDEAPDPMASYRAGSGDRMIRLTFREGRAFWRDLPVLLPDDTGQGSQPAAVLGFASNLHRDKLRPPEQPLLVAGLASDQAKLLRWRAERIGLPAILLDNPALASELRHLMIRCEDLFKLLRGAATRMIADTLPDSDNKESYQKARAIFDAGPASPTFFSAAERALPSMLALIAARDLTAAHDRWHGALREAAELAWAAVYSMLGRSSRSLRAEAIGYPRFRSRVNEWTGQTAGIQEIAHE